MIQLGQKQASQIRVLVLLAGVATTLSIWTLLADPISTPKLFVLVMFSVWILGTTVTSIADIRRVRLSWEHWTVVGFVVGILLAGVFSDIKFIAFFGAQQRNDGALAYLAFASLFFAAMVSFSPSNVGQVKKWLLAVGLVLSLHGLLQTFGHDPFRWNNLYNPVIGTLGNPDFFSGIVGATAIGSIWFVFAEKRRWLQGFGLAVLLIQLFVLKRCGSIQGIAAFAIGIALLLILKLWQIRKRLGVIAASVATICSIPIALGFLNIGPLASHLYRGSFRSRMDYWHAALEIFKTHPFAGVGLDRFGEYYPQYAPQIQIVQGQATDNAHNLFLQLAATGGLVVIVPFLLLLVGVSFSAIRAIRTSTGVQQLDIVALFSIWLALLLVSLISIDNLGVAIWFWITGGALCGVSLHPVMQNRSLKKPKDQRRVSKRTFTHDSTLLSPIVSLTLSIMVLLTMLPFLRSSSALFNLQRSASGLSMTQFVSRIDQAANIQSANIPALISLADTSFRGGAYDEGFKLVHFILDRDPRSLNGHYLGAIGYELQKKYEFAIPYRVKLLQLDPWSTKNMLQLVTDYVQVKDMDQARALSSKLTRLYPNSTQAQDAQKLIKG